MGSDLQYNYIYFKYDVNGKYYSISTDNEGKTIDLYEVYTPSGSNNIGRTLTYSGKSYTVISENGSDFEVVGNYVSSNTVTIGASEYSDALTDYNNVIITLNNAAADATGLTIDGTNVKGIRSIGISGNNDISGNFENPDSTTFSTYAGNAKTADKFYEIDLIKLYDANTVDVGSEYWIASRNIYTSRRELSFRIRFINNSYVNLGEDEICEVFLDNGEITMKGYTRSYAVRPVVTLNSNAPGIMWNS